MPDISEEQSLNLNDFLMEIFIRIFDYQRGYAWGKEQFEQVNFAKIVLLKFQRKCKCQR